MERVIVVYITNKTYKMSLSKLNNIAHKNATEKYGTTRNNYSLNYRVHRDVVVLSKALRFAKQLRLALSRNVFPLSTFFLFVDM